MLPNGSSTFLLTEKNVTLSSFIHTIEPHLELSRNGAMLHTKYPMALQRGMVCDMCLSLHILVRLECYLFLSPE